MIHARCANGHELQVQEQFAGRKGKCPKCGDMVQVPAVPPGEGDTSASLACTRCGAATLLKDGKLEDSEFVCALCFDQGQRQLAHDYVENRHLPSDDDARGPILPTLVRRKYGWPAVVASIILATVYAGITYALDHPEMSRGDFLRTGLLMVAYLVVLVWGWRQYLAWSASDELHIRQTLPMEKWAGARQEAVRRRRLIWNSIAMLAIAPLPCLNAVSLIMAANTWVESRKLPLASQATRLRRMVWVTIALFVAANLAVFLSI